MRVLLVEDDDAVAETLGEVLCELGEVRAAASVAGALAALEGAPFELVVSDLHLGGEADGGRTVLEAARRRLAPVLVLSGMSGDAILAALRPHRPDAWLSKPFDIDEVLRAAGRFTRLREEAEALAHSGSPPGAGWVAVAAGIEEASAGHPRASWVRVAPGARTRWPAPARPSGLLLTDGELELDGVRREGAQYLYLAAGQERGARSDAGCLALALSLAG